MRISVAVPLYNEECNVDELVHRVSAVLDALPGGPHEFVVVDDGSTDGTVAKLEAYARSDPRLRVVVLSRNFGHQAALSAALDHVSGDAVMVMDGDLQDPPELVPQFVEVAAQGFDVVYALRRTRRESWLMRSAYFLFYRVLQRLSDITIPVDAGDCALLSRRVVDEIRRTPERQRFLRGLRSWVGFRQVGVAVDRAGRSAGESKYTFGKLLRLASDGLLAFSTAPIRAAAILGAAVVALSGAFAFYSVLAKLVFGRPPQGFTALTVLIAMSSGVQLFFLGVIGEYVGRVYEEVKRRPLYIVSRVVEAGHGARAEVREWAGSSIR